MFGVSPVEEASVIFSLPVMILVCMYGLIHLLGVYFEANELPLHFCVWIYSTFRSSGCNQTCAHPYVTCNHSVAVHTFSSLSFPCNQSELPELALPIQALGGVQVLL